MDTASSHLSDFHLCHECLEGAETAITHLQRDHGPVTLSFLIGAGAEPGEAKELVDSLWADLLMPAGDKPSRLTRYDGSCALQTWLNTVALNRLLTRKRTRQRWDRLIVTRGAPAGEHDRGGESDYADEWSGTSDEGGPAEAPLIEIMRIAIESAFSACEPEDFVLLQLKHCDGLRGAELGLIFGCTESVISRRVHQAQEHIAAMTLWKVRQTDPWLELKWSDFVELARSATPACLGLD